MLADLCVSILGKIQPRAIWHPIASVNHPHEDPQAESLRRLAASEARYRSLVETPSLGVFLMDRAGNYEYVSAKMEELTGYQPEEFYRNQQLGYRMTHPDDHRIGERAFRRALLGRSTQHQEFRLIHRNGEIRWTSAACFPVYGDDQSVHSVQVIIQDITDRKLAEEELRREYEIRDAEAEIRVRIAEMDKPQDLFGVVDEISRQLNRLGVEHDTSSIQVLNTDATDFISCGFGGLGIRAERQLSELRRLSWTPTTDNASRYPWVREVWQTRVSRYVPATDEDSNLPVGMSLVDVPFSHGTLAINCNQTDAYSEGDIRLLERLAGVLSEGFQRFADIIQREHLEEQLRESQKMEAVGQLTAGVSHNFNNVLMVIVGNLQLAILDVSKETRELLEDALEASQRASDVVSQLMLFSRRSRGAGELLDLAPLVRRATDVYRRTFGPRITLNFESEDSLPPVLGSAGQLEQVVMNLCLNARDGLEGAELADPRIDVGLTLTRVERSLVPAHVGSVPDRCLCLTVCDNGAGMDEITRRRAFEPFFTTKDVGKGSGLGLSTVYAIVRGHDGWIDLESEPGEGATLRVYLPASAGDPVLPERPTTSPGGGESILLVEDEQGIRNVVRAMLERFSYTVLESVDGEEALELLSRRAAEVALVLLDLSMPRMSGQEVLQRLKIETPGLPVVIFTGQPGDVEDFPGAVAVLTKPVLSDELLHTIQKAIGPSRTP